MNKKEAEIEKGREKIVIQWDENLFSVEAPGEEMAYFINHSCDSNTWMNDACTLIAKRDIQTGEEITADYALWENDDYISTWECVCGSFVCRKKITGKDWMNLDIQERYKDHFSPLINKRIKKIKDEKNKNPLSVAD